MLNIVANQEVETMWSSSIASDVKYRIYDHLAGMSFRTIRTNESWCMLFRSTMAVRDRMVAMRLSDLQLP